MNLALGSLYAWSVFVLPLEKEFGWRRAQTSWVFTIAIVSFALSFIVAGKLQDRRGPRICAAIGGVLVSAGFVLSSTTTSLTGFYTTFGVLVGIGNGFGLLGSNAGRIEMVPGQARPRDRPHGGGIRRGLGNHRSSGDVLDAHLGWRPTFQILGLVFFAMTMSATALLRNPPPGYKPPSAPSARTTARATSDVPTATMLSQPTFYLLWIGYLSGQQPV